MTGPSDAGPEPTGSPEAPPPASSPGPPRPGARLFTIEGRAAPGLFVVGWIATVLGGALTIGGTAGASPPLTLLGLLSLSMGLVAGAGSQAIERRARGAPYAGPSPLLVFTAAIPVTFLAAAVVGLLLEALGVTVARPLASLLLVAIQVAVYVGLVRLLVVGTGALSWREMGFAGTVPRASADAVWGAVLAGPVIAVTTVVAVLLVSIVNRAPESPLPPTGQPIGLALNLLTGALLAPVGEEILFRGFATTAWARTMSAGSAVLRSSIVFALAHVVAVRGASLEEALAIALVGFGTRLPIAVALGFLFLRRGSIWAPIGLHAAFNGVILVLAELAPRLPAGP